jgi:hypothetical protein
MATHRGFGRQHLPCRPSSRSSIWTEQQCRALACALCVTLSWYVCCPSMRKEIQLTSLYVLLSSQLVGRPCSRQVCIGNIFLVILGLFSPPLHFWLFEFSSSHLPSLPHQQHSLSQILRRSGYSSALHAFPHFQANSYGGFEYSCTPFLVSSHPLSLSGARFSGSGFDSGHLSYIRLPPDWCSQVTGILRPMYAGHYDLLSEPARNLDRVQGCFCRTGAHTSGATSKI